jgi:hypothetical protein
MTFHVCSSPAPTSVKLQPTPTILSQERCQSLITTGNDHPPVLEPHMVLDEPTAGASCYYRRRTTATFRHLRSNVATGSTSCLPVGVAAESHAAPLPLSDVSRSITAPGSYLVCHNLPLLSLPLLSRRNRGEAIFSVLTVLSVNITPATLDRVVDCVAIVQSPIPPRWSTA